MTELKAEIVKLEKLLELSKYPWTKTKAFLSFDSSPNTWPFFKKKKNSLLSWILNKSLFINLNLSK